jgi:hypothetical protein
MPDGPRHCKSRGAAGANDRAEDGAQRSQFEKREAPVNLRQRKAKAPPAAKSPHRQIRIGAAVNTIAALGRDG